jgi:hypothetical protein
MGIDLFILGMLVDSVVIKHENLGYNLEKMYFVIFFAWNMILLYVNDCTKSVLTA